MNSEHNRRPISMIIDRSSNPSLTSVERSKEVESTNRLLRQNSEPVQWEKVDPEFDPLAPPPEQTPPIPRVVSTRNMGGVDLSQLKSASLTLQLADETRVASAMYEASKKKKTGSIYHLRVDLSSTGTLGLGVKALKNNILAVSMLKRSYGALGSGESAGVRLGDIIMGVNFIPCRDGAKTLLNVLQDHSDTGKIITLQCWRCHQLCSDPVPGQIFPRCDDVLVQGFALYRSYVLSDWERWNFVEIILGYMKDEVEFRQSHPTPLPPIPPQATYPQRLRAIHNQVLDLEKNILQAKGLRTALCARIISTCFSGDTVEYMIRIEDIESGRQWVVRRRYRDFLALHVDLQKMSNYTRDIPFPKKRLVSLRTTAYIIEERIVALEQFLRMAIYRLTHYSTMDAEASQALRRMQLFLEVPDFVDCFHPPSIDDQRNLEMIVFQHLNDFTSSTCQQCIRFIDSVNLDSLIGTGNGGYQPILELMSQALQEVEEYTIPAFLQQMTNLLNDRQPSWGPDRNRTFIRRCVRRQVESAVFLPLRRTTYRIVYSFLAVKTDRFHRALQILKDAPQSIFGLGIVVFPSPSLTKAIEHFREMVSSFLPADQGYALMKASAAVMELHGECNQKKRRGSVNNLSPPVVPTQDIVDQTPLPIINSDMLNQAILADPTGTIFSVPERQLIPPRYYNEDGLGGGLLPRDSTLRDRTSSLSSPGDASNFFGEKNATKYSGLDLRKIVVAAYTDGNNPRAGAFEDTRQSKELILDVLLKSITNDITSGETFKAKIDSSTPLFDSPNPKRTNSTSHSSAPVKVSIEDTPLCEEADDTIDREGWDESSFPVRGNDTGSDTTSQISNTHHDAVKNFTVVGADDFLPLFVYVLVQANLPQLILVKEIMSALLDQEELYGECGYYMATLEAALQHILDLADEYSTSLTSLSSQYQSSL